MVKTYVMIRKQAIRRPAMAKPADDRIEADAGLDYAAIFNEPEDPVWQEAWQITERLISTMADEVEQHGRAVLGRHAHDRGSGRAGSQPTRANN
jgi:hypothetical protein